MSNLYNLNAPYHNSLQRSNKISVRGGRPLSGEVKPDGAKNSSLYALITAVYIDEGWMVFDNVPQITDIQQTLNVLEEIGMQHSYTGQSLQVYGKCQKSAISEASASKIRSSICFLGPLLSRFGTVSLPLPGGDKIGDRPIDIHIDVIERFGGQATIENGFVNASLDLSQLQGQEVYLRFPSVGATINALFLAVTAKGKSVIFNAAKEPEIVDLINLLNKMGASIHGGGTDRIVVEGVAQLHATSYEILPDRLEVGALMMSFAMTKGKGVIKGAIPEHNRPLIHMMQSVGISVDTHDDEIHVDATQQPTRGFSVETQPYPGLATDLQAICTAFALVCPEPCTIKDTVFSERFGHVEGLRKMGASIDKTGNRLLIQPPKNALNSFGLSGANVEGGDIRAVVSLILTALAIDDTSTIDGVDHLLRGHIRFVEKLQHLNADIHYAL